MNEQTNPDYLAKLERLAADRIAVATSIADALKTAGYAVQCGDEPYEPRAGLKSREPILLRVFSDKLEGWTQEFQITPYHDRGYNSRYRIITCTVVWFGLSRGLRARDRRDTKFGGLEKRAVAYADEKLAQAVEQAKVRAETHQQEKEAEEVREAALGVLVLPPGMEVASCVGLDVGRYMVKFGHYGYYGRGLYNTKLTADQVKRLVALVSEIVGVDNLYMVLADGGNGCTVYCSDQSDAQFFSPEFGRGWAYPKPEAEAMAVKAKAEDIFEGIRLVPYAEAYLSAQKSAGK